MADQTRQQLQQAFQLIKAGQRQEAGRILVALLKQDRDNADAWWLLANASSDAKITRQALENVLRLRPDNSRARQMLDKLNEGLTPSPSSTRFSMPISPSSPPPQDDPFAAPEADVRSSSSRLGGLAARDMGEVSAADDDPLAARLSGRTPSGSAADDDPFASSAGHSFTGSFGGRTSASQDDPFASDSDDSAADDDPFAALRSTPTPSRAPEETPSSSAVISRPGARTAPTQSTSLMGDDPFHNTDFGGDPFAEVSSTRGAAAVPGQRRSGANPVVVILLVVAVIGVVGCAICLVAVAGGATFFGQQFGDALQEIVLTVTAMPGAGSGQNLGSNLNARGTIAYGQSKQATVDTFTDDSWTFSGAAGDRVTIEANANDNDLDPQLELYSATDKQIAQNDDVNTLDNKNARIVMTLPASGAYTVVVSAFGTGGPYTLKLSKE